MNLAIVQFPRGNIEYVNAVLIPTPHARIPCPELPTIYPHIVICA